jgi:hypothetical protein
MKKIYQVMLVQHNIPVVLSTGKFMQRDHIEKTGVLKMLYES